MEEHREELRFKDEKKRIQKERRQNYRYLKLSLILRAILITSITGAIGTFIVSYIMDLTSMGAYKIYFVALFFFVLFVVTFYRALTKITTYLDDVVDSIDNVLEDSREPIALIEELRPVENKLNDLKISLRQKEKDAQAAEQKKNDLVLYLAHDLKTPLTSIIAYLDILNSDPDMPTKERAKYTRISYEKALRLNELILEFFDITKYNLQDIALEKEVIDLSLMLAQLADELYGVLQEKDLVCELQTDEELLAYGDPDKLARVFDNLLRNAVAYSHPHTRISITAREVGEWTEIVFCNRGETIDKASLGSIFEKFYRADNSRSSETGGAGLGLAIAKEIVELHDGKISATSEDGETRFIVVLPEQSEEAREEKARRLKRRIEEAIEGDKIRKPVTEEEAS